MITYILLVAAVNVGLGFGLGAHLGRRYRALAAGDGAADETPTAQSLEAALADVERTLEQSEPAESPVVEPPVTAAVPDMLQALRTEIDRFQDQLTATEEPLRQCGKSPEVAAVEAHRVTLLATVDEYAGRCDAVLQSLAALSGDGVLGEPGRDLWTAIEHQRSEIDIARRTLAPVDEKSAPDACCRRIANQLARLMIANHHLRDRLDVCSGTGLEAGLSPWWNEDPQRTRSVSVAVFDMDQFARANERLGCQTADRILRTIPHLLQLDQHGEETRIHSVGQRFLFLFPDADAAHAMERTERIRQTIETTVFIHGDEEFRLTASCAIAEAAAGETPGVLLCRAETALGEAKRYGRNRAFVHEGTRASPVVPLDFSMEEKRVTL